MVQWHGQCAWMGWKYNAHRTTALGNTWKIHVHFCLPCAFSNNYTEKQINLLISPFLLPLKLTKLAPEQWMNIRTATKSDARELPALSCAVLTSVVWWKSYYSNSLKLGFCLSATTSAFLDSTVSAEHQVSAFKVLQKWPEPNVA